uniref:Uncharacterized protein n=1 Tax=Chrysemys picta bellii TaxID=8478 RepID=A0A8C3FN61_CHRPI
RPDFPGHVQLLGAQIPVRGGIPKSRACPGKIGRPHLTFFPLVQETVIGLSAFSLAVLGPAGWFLFHLPSYKKK